MSDRLFVGIIVGVIISFAVFLVGFRMNMPDRIITTNATVTKVQENLMSDYPLVTLTDEDGENWQVYNRRLEEGDKVQLRINTHETIKLDDDEVTAILRR